MGDRVGVELLFNSVEFGSQSSCQQTSGELGTRCGKESHTRPMGLEALMNWGPEKMLIRCSKESQHPAVDPKTSGWASKRTRKTQRDGHKELKSKYEVYVRSPAPSQTQTLQIKWEVNIFLKKSSCVLLASLSLCCCDAVDDYTTIYI